MAKNPERSMASGQGTTRSARTSQRRRATVRRRAVSVALAVTTLVAVAASVLGVGLIVASGAPFDRAFASQRGAHLTVTVGTASLDAPSADAAHRDGPLRATKDLSAVSSEAGPFAMATVPARLGGGTGRDLGLLTIVGRDTPAAQVDSLTLTAGRWPRAPGEVALDPRGLPINIGEDFVGKRIEVGSGANAPSLTIVGLARSVTHTADAWAVSSAIAALSGPSGHVQMLYRFRNAATGDELQRDGAAIRAALPDDAVTGASSYLAVREAVTANAAAFGPFVTAFGLLSMMLSILVIGIVVGGVVGAARREIGILKAIGFGPGRIARRYTTRTLAPTLAGAVIGGVAAGVAARPILADIDHAYGGAAAIPTWLALTVAGAVVVLAAIAALIPAIRLARQPAAALMGPGRGDAPGRMAQRFQRAIAGLRLPRHVALGLAAPLRRPARSAALGATILVASACLAFAAGLLGSVNLVQQSRNPLSGAAVQVGPQFNPPDPTRDRATGDGAPLPSAPHFDDPNAIRRAIAEIPGTAAVFGTVEADMATSGLAGGSPVVGISGDAAFTHHEMVRGRWLSGRPHEVVMPTAALRARGLTVGGRMILSANGRHATVTIVGEVFDLSHHGMRIYTRASTLAKLGIETRPDEFDIAVQPGTDLHAYLDAVTHAVAPLAAEADLARDGSSDVLVVMNAVITLLSAMLLLVAGIGIVSTATLDVRERIRELGIFKALGMIPRHIRGMTLTAVGITALIGTILGVPAGIAIHHIVVPRMGAVAGAVLTPDQVGVYHGSTVAALTFGGIGLAIVGALRPAHRASRLSGAAALRAE